MDKEDAESSQLGQELTNDYTSLQTKTVWSEMWEMPPFPNQDRKAPLQAGHRQAP